MPAQFTGPETLGINLERIDSSAKHNLGQVCHGITALGHAAKFRYVKFVDAVTYVAGQSVALASATTWDVSNDRAGGSSLAGIWPVGIVFQATVPTQNTYGWVQITGIASLIIGSAAVIAGDLLMPDASEDGENEEATAGTHENIIAVALATIADNATGLCVLAIRGA